MKKSIKLLALVLTVAMLCVALVSCGKTLSGEYESDVTAFGTGLVTTYEFSGSKVTLTLETKLAGTVTSENTIEGKYSIKDDKITFEFEGDDEDAKKYSTTADFEEGEDYIKIGIVEFKKK